MNDLEIYKTIQKYHKQGKKAALATVVDVKGSTPRSIGAKMVIAETGECSGTVGGGCVEGQVKQVVANAFKEKSSDFVTTVDLIGTPGQAGMDVCGGRMQIMVEIVKPD